MDRFLRLENEVEISAAQSTLASTIRVNLSKRMERDIGYPSDTVRGAKIFTDGNFWYREVRNHRPTKGVSRHLNWFGYFKPEGSLSITAELNVPIQGQSGLVSGFLARNLESGVTYLMHSGRIGGGHKGVGKERFLAYSGARLIETLDSKNATRLAVPVMSIDGSDAIQSLERYLEQVGAFKQAVRDGATDKPDVRKQEAVLKSFYSESYGTRAGLRRPDFDYVSRHGEIVDALAKWRRARGLMSGETIRKNVYVDMGVCVDTRMTEVYEVKSSQSRSSLYSAIGQIMVHSSGSGSQGCDKYLVVPNGLDLPRDVQQALNNLQIKLLRCVLSARSAQIEEYA